MKYSVLIKPRIMIRIDGVEAGSHEEAVVKAIEKYESSAQDLIGRDLENYNRNDPEGSFRYMEFAESEDIFEARDILYVFICHEHDADRGPGRRRGR